MEFVVAFLCHTGSANIGSSNSKIHPIGCCNDIGVKAPSILEIDGVLKFFYLFLIVRNNYFIALK